ncbi:ketol-acid reductoisomerase [Halobacteroides halobius DSM 5150]|uniref:Ketol-acid reductoisomerase (NADP(+)) n=1 Tax=Halobacteroides halobius (strain ATCC 35273 / DSM 5150 / MD-1) TaxID=748449 RepID=L0K4R1_HALHC|nr:ketol-acid reductoisomerase [Halobacteroides halobius]AGB40257.1 ketol-acid reductoisomerase [Halobacteroides halobius DSM 5150]
MVKMYYNEDADLKYLEGKKVAVIGYGSQGHAQAQNMREAGLDVIVGQRKGGASYEQAVADGFKPVSAAEAAKQADVIQVLLPDEVQKKVYYNDIEPNLEAGNALVFSHGFNIHFEQILPPTDVDVYMVAPKGPGHLVRRVYEDGSGVPCLIAIYQDATGDAKEKALAHAKGVGGTRAGVIETSFKEETETDLFGEQAVLCGGASELVRAGFETLVDAGYQPEIAYFECLHELKLIVDLMYEGGIATMRDSISDTAEYGDLIAGKQVINDKSREAMQKLLKDIQTGEFAKQWLLENQVGRPAYSKRKEIDANHQIEQVGEKLRSKMNWIEE